MALYICLICIFHLPCIFPYVLKLFSFFVGLGFEVRVSHLSETSSTSQDTPPVLKLSLRIIPNNFKLQKWYKITLSYPSPKVPNKHFTSTLFFLTYYIILYYSFF
jgi:hypothetical protein